MARLGKEEGVCETSWNVSSVEARHANATERDFVGRQLGVRLHDRVVTRGKIRQVDNPPMYSKSRGREVGEAKGGSEMEP